MSPTEVRAKIVETLGLDLVGPAPGHEFESELLPDPPHTWYLTGYLVPKGAPIEQKSEDDGLDELDSPGEGADPDGNSGDDRKAAKRPILPSSMGLSVLLPESVNDLTITVSWGEYKAEYEEPEELELTSEKVAPPKIKGYRRRPRAETWTVPVPSKSGGLKDVQVPNQKGLKITVTVRPLPREIFGDALSNARAVSIFLVNERNPITGDVKYEAFVFQTCLKVECEGFLPRPNLRGAVANGIADDDLDELISDLQYRDVVEFAVGHGVAAQATEAEIGCVSVETTWLPQAYVERVIPGKIEGVELRMERLAELDSVEAAHLCLDSLVEQYRSWLQEQRITVEGLSPKRQETANLLIDQALCVATRIDRGIELLANPNALLAFQLANRSVARAARQRNWFTNQKEGTPADGSPPTWRPFQLAFLLMSLEGIVDPHHDDRERVDLLFFPTGGGKTEAYLGLAAFAMVYRRLTNEGPHGCGVSVLMRYTLRLLTLDQLGRAAGLMCALELERQEHPEYGLGEWPFEIGLWVGQASTPNRLGRQGDNDQRTAYHKTRRFQMDKGPSPIPLENCPWCGTKFGRNSFRMMPNILDPVSLGVHCVDERCAFSGAIRSLPIIAVDEPIYRRLPAFMIATVDKFAALPWTGQTGALFGQVDRADKHGFYGPCEPGQGTPIPGGILPGPDLIIQDELHLISGPLGTIAGVYETAIDYLCSRGEGTARIRPKIITSTATVRRAPAQIRALFERNDVWVFPPPGIDRRNSFFAITKKEIDDARLYVGVAAQGRNLKVVLLRTALALLSSAQVQYDAEGGNRKKPNTGDAYMPLVGYFNSLRELGGSRRIIEDEVRGKLLGYERRRRIEPEEQLFARREIDFDVMELTSRVSTDRVAQAKERLGRPHYEKGAVDVALATNMISVGLDISRLGLMLVFGQPKTSSEYIQATSRVGRDPDRFGPGLVVTLLNVHKPRDRSHYERFASYHASFYRAVEATSITPFSPRALDRALPAALVALCRHGLPSLTAPQGADLITTKRHELDRFAQVLGLRAKNHRHPPDPTEPGGDEALRNRVVNRCTRLLDDWLLIAKDAHPNTMLQYTDEIKGGTYTNLLFSFLDESLAKLHPIRARFRANRSMRDVEPSVDLDIKQLNEMES